jgi:hypothetical protein
MTYDDVDDYQRKAIRTEHLPAGDPLGYLLMGLAGEVGSLIAEVKKRLRDEPTGYRASVEEELGDALWYLAALAHRLCIRLSEVSRSASRFGGGSASDHRDDPVPRCLALAAVAGRLASDGGVASVDRESLRLLLGALVDLALAEGVDPDAAASSNLLKADARWPSDRRHVPLFDPDDDPDERLPRRLDVEVIEKHAGSRKPFVIMKCHGLQIGDRITDNIAEPDDYQFHDVFHMSYAAVLGWSPVLRGLLRCKRKSNGNKDEEQDGARAAIVEEAVVAWLFRHASSDKRGFYEGYRSLDYSTLKQVHSLVQGYEVEKCPYWQWEDAILQGFEAFRFLRRERRARISIDLDGRRLAVSALTS